MEIQFPKEDDNYLKTYHSITNDKEQFDQYQH